MEELTLEAAGSSLLLTVSGRLKGPAADGHSPKGAHRSLMLLCRNIMSRVFSRPKPSAFNVKFSLWKKSQAQNTTDIVPVQEIIIHPRYESPS